MQLNNTTMNPIVSEQIESYCEAHTTRESELLRDLSRETCANIARPHMLSGHLQGRFLSMISKMIKPQYVLEIGTYTGYSALCLAEGIRDGGELHTIELDPKLEEIIVKYFNASEHRGKIHLYIGNAAEIIPKLDKTWDLVFIDANKKKCLQYYEMVLPHVRSGGFVLVDNVLWEGKVTEPAAQNDVFTKTFMEFNDFVQNDPRVLNMLLPLRDGLMLIEKL